MRCGIGFDIHPLVKGRKLVLAGVEIPFEYGLDGWSDADTLTHAVIDALLGAAAMGDIGVHFPPGDPAYKDISSLKMLLTVKQKITAAGWHIENIDATIITEKPRLRDYIEPMRMNYSKTLDIHINQVGLKASTANGVGSIGKGDGIAALAIASLSKITKI